MLTIIKSTLEINKYCDDNTVQIREERMGLVMVASELSGRWHMWTKTVQPWLRSY